MNILTDEDDDNTKDYDMIIKFVIVGDSSVGKSSILLRYIDKEYSLNQQSTIGIEFSNKSVKMGD